MSFDIFFRRFDAGVLARSDSAAVLAVLEPLVDDHGDGWVHITTADGEADVYGMADPASG